MDGSCRRRVYLRLAGAAVVLASLIPWSLSASHAAEQVLKFHHFLPESSPHHQDIFLRWAKLIAQASKGQMRISVTGAMQLGGTPADLASQVAAGQVDMAYTLAGYTPGRFPRIEVFELPRIASSRGSATSRALHEFYELYARDDFPNLHVLALWCSPSGVILSRDQPISVPADASGRVLRVPSVAIGEAFRALGARPQLMPAPKVLKELQARTIDGALFPYEIIPTLKIADQVRHITEFAGHRGFFTAVFLLVMSKKTYESLDQELRAVIDTHSGASLSAQLGQMWDDLEESGRVEFAAAGGEVTFVKNENYEAWVAATRRVYDTWRTKADRMGLDGTNPHFSRQPGHRPGRISESGCAIKHFC